MTQELPAIKITKTKTEPDNVCIFEETIEVKGKSLKNCFNYIQKIKKEVL
jgi:hypothetical protein